MAIRIIEGSPGGGKSYYGVWWLVTNFCVQLKDGRWIVDPAKNVRVISNISHLKIAHEDFQACLDEAGGFENFFTKQYQAKFSRGCSLIYLIDEAQQWFRSRRCKLTNDNLLYFEWARHEGHDFWLLTQHIKKIDFEVACLAEVVVRALPRTNNVSSELTYVDRTFEGIELESRRLLFDKQIADLYKSENRKEAVAIRNPRLRRLLWALALSLLLTSVGLYFFWGRVHKIYSNATKSSSLSSSAASSSPPASASAVSSAGAAASKTTHPADLQSALSAVSNPAAQSQQQVVVEYYMYRLDHAVFKDGVRFLLGITWISPRDFPYTFIKKGSAYFAMIPAVLLPALESGSRALPIRTNTKE